MRTKNHAVKKGTLSGNPATEVVVSRSEFEGEVRVVLHVKQFDAYGFPHVTAVHSMGLDEAESLAKRLVDALYPRG